jgi:hypothetical protein
MRTNSYIIDPIKPRDNYMYCHMALLKHLRFANILYLFISYDSQNKEQLFSQHWFVFVMQILLFEAGTEFLYEV